MREAALARLGTALADPTRRRILVALQNEPGYPAKLAEQPELTRSDVSNHLACLRGCGLVAATYAGRQVRYELADPHLSRALDELLQVVLAVEPSPQCLDADAPVSGPPVNGTADCCPEPAGGPAGPRWRGGCGFWWPRRSPATSSKRSWRSAPVPALPRRR